MPLTMSLRRTISGFVCLLTAASMLLSLSPAIFACACAVSGPATPTQNDSAGAPARACCEMPAPKPVRSCCDRMSDRSTACCCCPVTEAAAPAKAPADHAKSCCPACACCPLTDSVPPSAPVVFVQVNFDLQIGTTHPVVPTSVGIHAERLRSAHHPPLPTDLLISQSRLNC
jgi:hypothetical protein